MNKNTNSKSKKNSKKQNNNKVAAQPEIIASVANGIKRSKGRPIGTSSSSLVSLKSLVGVLSESASIPISNRLLKALNQLGTNIESTPFKCDMKGIGEIASKYRQNSSVVLVDLNAETAMA